jgi:soluble lytic murein transglycosylase
MKMAHRRKRGRANPLGIVIIILAALAAAAVIAVMLRRLNDSQAARYPVLYADEICAAAEENSIPAPYIAAVIMAESSYDPNAVSSVGAQGLMQIMPETGEWISGKLDDTYTEGRMFDPQACIRYGSWYLGFLMDRYSGDMRCATAAYHAGQGTVDRWLSDPAYSPDGASLSAIEYDTTSVYVERVLDYYEYYVNAYAELAGSAETIE